MSTPEPVKYFTFPLPLLFPQEDYHATLQRIVSYCVRTIGAKAIVDLEEHVADGILSSRDHPDDFEDDRQDHRKVRLGAERLGVETSSCARTLGRAEDAERIITAVEKDWGASPLVFVSRELLWGCHDEHFPTYRNFTVICAVNSVIGTKKTPVLIRREMLRARAAGFKTLAAYEKAVPKYANHTRRPLLSMSQLRTTLDRLEEKEMFVRVVASKRRTYFSQADRATAQQQVADIVKKQSADKLAVWRAQEQALMARARATQSPE